MQYIRSTNDREWPVTGTGKRICTYTSSKVNTNCLRDYAVVGTRPCPFRRTERSSHNTAETTRSVCGMWKWCGNVQVNSDGHSDPWFLFFQFIVNCSSFSWVTSCSDWSHYKHRVWSVTWSPDDKTLVSVSLGSDKTIKFWNTNKGQVVLITQISEIFFFNFVV
jgi:WD40 repeat protein